MCKSVRQTRRLTKSLDEKKQQKHRLLTAYINGNVKQADYQESNEIFDAQIADIQREIASTHFENAAVDDLLDFSQRVLADLPCAWMSAKGPTKEKFQTLLFQHGLTYDPKEGFLNSDKSPVISQLNAVRRDIYQVWRPRRDLNPCYRRERPPPFTALQELGGRRWCCKTSKTAEGNLIVT
jgi:hypothetical protein